MIDQLTAEKRRVEIAFELGEMPDPQKTLTAAMAEPSMPLSLCASDYGEAVEALRSKGFTWNECAAWLKEHGADYSMQAVVSGHRTWKRRRAAELLNR